jgi:5-methylcytosine-specific restriction endonuclease McrA
MPKVFLKSFMDNIDPDEQYPLTELYYYILERDGGYCQQCGRKPVELHHIIPRSMGGRHYANNLIMLCKHHHESAHQNLSAVTPVLKGIVAKNEKFLRKKFLE